MNIDAEVGPEFLRNIGVNSVSEQQKLQQTRIAVAGAGGVGGLHVLTLARLGVGKFVIADPDTFDVVNISRQFGASHATIGRNKAEVLGEMVLDINPSAEVRVMPVPVSPLNVGEFLEDVQVYVDGIDFFEIDTRRLIFNASRSRGIFAVTAAPLGFGATLQTFSPSGMSFDEYFGIDDQASYEEKVAAFAAGLAPMPLHVQYMDFSKVSLARRTGPAVAPGCTLATSLLATEVVKIVTGKGEVRPVPYYLQFDMLLNRYETGVLELGGRDPQQLAKRALILEMFGGGQQEGGGNHAVS